MCHSIIEVIDFPKKKKNQRGVTKKKRRNKNSDTKFYLRGKGNISRHEEEENGRLK